MSTIKDVAKRAGVSTATVSRVLNKSGYASESVKKKVLTAVSELDYKPNEIARSLFQKKSKFIGLLLPDIANPFFPLLAKGAEQCLEERGYQLLLCNTENNREKEASYLDTFIQNNVSGIIVATGEELRESIGIPYVVVDRMISDSKLTVTSNSFDGGYLAGSEICRRSPRKVLVMEGPQSIKGAVDRKNGILNALYGQGVAYEVFSSDSYASDISLDLAEKIFSLSQDFDSIIATNDIHALSILQKALEKGISVPDDLQIIGYDGIPFGQMIYPTLATIQQPIFEMGKNAADNLIDYLESDDNQARNIVLPVTFYEGGTVREISD